MLNNNLIALIVTFFLALAWLRVNDFAAQRGWISSDLSRKIIHIGTGPIFVLCWMLFNTEPSARFLAALVPLLITAQFILVGTGILKDESAVKAMSRSGDRREILRGPLYYGIAFVALTLIYWRDSAIGIVALMILCGGDGLADIIGKRLGKARIPWSPNKSWAGTAGMFIGGWVLSMLVIAIYAALGYMQNPLLFYMPRITLIAFVATLVETLPLNDIDNITVTISSVLLGILLY